MKTPPYLGRSLLSVFLLLPLLFQLFVAAATFVAGLADKEPSYAVVSSVAAPLFLFLCVLSGRNAVRQPKLFSQRNAAEEPLPDYRDDGNAFVRYQPVIAAFAYTLTMALIGLSRPPSDSGAVFGPFLQVFATSHLTSSFVLWFASLFAPPSPWTFLLPPVLIYAAYAGGIAWGFRERRAPRCRTSAWIAALGVLLLAGCGIVWRTGIMKTGILPESTAETLPETLLTEDYHPFAEGNRLVTLPSPSLTIAGDHPKLDGATAAYPVYAAAAQAIYQNCDVRSIRRLVDSSTTPRAYERLIAGEADLIFTGQPSPQQRAAAEATGRPLRLTPIGKEAFVFFVHRDNPVENLTSDQIRGIYTKTIRHWSEISGSNHRILAFQRPQGSGSQTALELKVMQGEKPFPPLREEAAEGMGGIIQRVASYRNSREAIGYSFRFFATAMNPLQDIKLLSIDGIAPTKENIRAGTYPYAVDVYAVTNGTTHPHVPALIDWFLSAEGQDLVEQAGYVRLPAP